MPLLRDYIAEHERAVDHGREAVRALDHDHLDEARRRLAVMFDELRAHWQGEENGLFAVMHADELYAEHIDPLIAEHRELAAFLEVADVTDPADQARVRAEVEALYAHIA